jgi:hypothetical protein
MMKFMIAKAVIHLGEHMLGHPVERLPGES